MEKERSILRFWCPKCQDGEGHYFDLHRNDSDIFQQNGINYIKCPLCHKKIPEAPGFIYNLRPGNNTGPTTIKGKKISSMNNWKTGEYARKNFFRPARPGRYSLCENCEYKNLCENGDFIYCPKDTDIVAQHLHAFAENNPEMLRDNAAFLNARIYTIAIELINEIEKNGIIEPIYYRNKKGEVVFINKNEKNPNGEPVILRRVPSPAIDVVIKIMEKMGYTPQEWNMTPASEIEGKRKESETQANANFDFQKFIAAIPNEKDRNTALEIFRKTIKSKGKDE